MNHFYRCDDCLSIMTTTERIRKQFNGQNEILPQCGLCNGRLQYMGETNGGKLIKFAYTTPCDGRCTGATGPSCDCSCGGANHGNGKVVKVTIEQGGIPKLQTPNSDKALAIAQEFRQTLESIKIKLEKLPYYEYYRRGIRIDRNDWWRIENAKRQIYEAKKCKIHKTRMKKLSGINF